MRVHLDPLERLERRAPYPVARDHFSFTVRTTHYSSRSAKISGKCLVNEAHDARVAHRFDDKGPFVSYLEAQLAQFNQEPGPNRMPQSTVLPKLPISASLEDVSLESSGEIGLSGQERAEYPG